VSTTGRQLLASSRARCESIEEDYLERRIMAKGQVRKEKSNKPKLSHKEKEQKKKEKQKK
jgi:hypothetical protein